MHTQNRTMQPSRGGGRGRALAMTLVALSLSAASVAHATAPLCSSAIFQCQDSDGVTHGKNLVVLLFDERRNLKWIVKHCGQPVDRTPYRCDWQRSVRLGKLAAVQAPSSPNSDAAPSATAPPPATSVRPTAADRAAVPAPRSGRGPLPPPPRAPEITGLDRSPYAAEIKIAADRYRLPGDLIRAVIKIESNFNPRAVSIKGAKGLMQLMPDVAHTVGVEDPFEPGPCILGGARLLRILANRFNGDLVKVLSAFHAGSTPVKAQGGTPFASTDGYVRKVLGVYYALRDG